MPTRRDFLTTAAALATAGAAGNFLDVIKRAAAIEPAVGSSYLDAEHVVILMQENRSFDHSYGTLRGVRGFEDPRAITLPDGNPVWVQTDAKGKRYAPFRYDIKNTKITWMGCLPHGWSDQVDARNGGRYDKWLVTKQASDKQFADMPLTLGYYTREDIPFYYALADAFTICDQYFCSSLTGTTPNRCYLWTGTVRERQTADAPAVVRNEECDLDHIVSWPTFPERLESLGVSWRVYQNELTVPTGFTETEDAWLSNFGDNPLEYFRQFNVYLSPRRKAFVADRLAKIPAEIEELKKQTETRAGQNTRTAKRIAELSGHFMRYQAEAARFKDKSLDRLSPYERALHERAFTTNDVDPNYRQLEDVVYQDGGTERHLRAPKSDVLHQFRADVNAGKLPTVSWIVAPQTFSDHPSSAWYGAWYIAEVMKILTSNPEVWKKTIFMLTYDENDGYFDHVPPFVAPHPRKTETGRTSQGIDTGVDYVELAQDIKRGWGRGSRGSSIGLGYRVPMVIASPWSRGGAVCSQVSDHTSVIQFLEKLLGHKLGKPVVETNISRWRRAVCGDLTTSFREAKDGDATVGFPARNKFLESIHRAQFTPPPSEMKPIGEDDLAALRLDPAASPHRPKQEPGTRPSSPLPYELVVDGGLHKNRSEFAIHFEVRNKAFGNRSSGAPFVVYALETNDGMMVRDYAAEPGTRVADVWKLTDFKDGRYHLRAYGPNGFFREFIGQPKQPAVDIELRYTTAGDGKSSLSPVIEVVLTNNDKLNHSIDVRDNAYGQPLQTRKLAPGEQRVLTFDTAPSQCWYDLSIQCAGVEHFAKRYAGRVETGAWSTSDPMIGRTS